MLIKEKYDQMDWLSYGSQQREEGANQQAATTAEKMLRKNKPLSEIVDFSGLTEAAVRTLAEKLKLTVEVG